MTTKLDEFRGQYPQYDNFDDEELASKIHSRFYSDMDVEEYRSKVGLAPLPQPEKPPSIGQKITDFFSRKPSSATEAFSEKPEIAEIDPTEPEPAGTAAPKQPRLVDQIYAGWNEYRANQAEADAFAIGRSYQNLGEIEDLPAEDLVTTRGGTVVPRGENRGYSAMQSVRSEPMAPEKIVEQRQQLVGALQSAIDKKNERRAKANEIGYSASTEELLGAESFSEGVSEFLDDPVRIIAEISLRSAPGMLESLPMAAAGSVAGPIGFAAGMGAGTASVEYRASFSEALREEGVDIDNAADLVSALENEEVMQRAHKKAATRAKIVGTAGALSGGVSTQTLTPMVKNVVARELSNVAVQTGVQGAIDAGGEAIAQLATDREISAGEVIAEGIGGAASAPIDVGGATITGVRGTMAQRRAAAIESEINAMMDDGTPEPTGDAGDIATDTAEAPFTPTFFDERLGEESYRTQLQNLSNELSVGGDISYIRDGGDAIVGRTASANPPWFQEMQQTESLAMPVRNVWKAVDKAITGKPLGVREQAVVDYMLGEIDWQNSQEPRYSRAPADDEVQFSLETPAQEEARISEINGKAFDESEYSVDMDQVSRETFEAMEIASEYLTVDQISNLARVYDDPIKLQEALERESNAEVSKASTGKPKAEQAAEPQAPNQERRKDLERRNRVAEMSRDEIIENLYTDPLTGLANRRAFEEEAEYYDHVASIDVDSLKFINDNLGHDAGDALLASVGEALDQAGVEAYRAGGDEFYLLADSPEEMKAALDLAETVLTRQKLSAGRASVNGLGITYGIGQDKASADSNMEVRKKTRESEGKRSSRGLPPPGYSVSMRPGETVDMNPGTNYVKMIGNTGDLPVNPNLEYVLGNGRTVRIPKTPIRRDHIIALMQKRFGNKIYEGRVKGKKTRLGYYRVGQGAIRIRNANDIETAAHEVAHWLDDRHPWISRLYKQPAFQEEIAGVSYDESLDFEGYAEFMRLFFTQDAEARKAAPGFYDAWMKELAKHEDLKETVYELQELMHAWTQQGARARGASKHGATVKDFFTRTREALVPDGGFKQAGLDGLASIKRAELDITKDRETVAYKKLRLALGGANSVSEAAYYFGTPGFRGDGGGLEYTGESLRAIFGKDWGNEDLALYMMGRRAQELKEQGRENLLRDDEIASFLSIAKEKPEYEDMFSRYQEFNRRMMDFFEDAGIINAETRATIEAANQNYVPFHRVIDGMVNGRQNIYGGSPFMRLKGSTRNVQNVFDNIINNNAMMIRAALINDGKRQLYRTIAGARNQQGGVYAEPIAKDVKGIGVDKGQVIKAVVEAMGYTMKDYRLNAKGFGHTEADNQMAEVIQSAEKGMEDFVTLFQFGVDPKGTVDFYFEDGEKKFFEIADAGLLDSLKFMGPKPTNLVLSIFGGASALLRRGTVAVPVFQVKNFVRDTTNAWLLSSHVKVPAARAMSVALSRIEKSPAYQDMMLNGGGFANRSQGLEAQRKLVIDPTKAVAAYDRFMGRFENANRVAEFEAARLAGKSPIEASLASREISTDFAMRGSNDVARVLAISVPFLNARVQSLYRIGKQLNRSDLALSYAMRGAALTTATLALYMLNRDDERYKELPEDIKDLYWVFYTGDGEDDYFLVPKPFESGMLFATIPERMMEFSREKDGEEFADALGWMALETFNMDMTPQVFAPYLELQANKNFTGAPILPFYLENVEPQQQYTYYTSETMKALGNRLGTSPVKTEHMFRGYTGTLGTYLLAASDAAISAAVNPDIEDPTRGETWKENIVVKALIDPLVNEGPPRRTKYVTDLYDMVKEAEKTAKTYELMLRRNSAGVLDYVNDPQNQALIAMNEVLSSVRSEMNEINKSMDLVRMSDSAGDDKRLQLWELTRQRNKLAQTATAEIRRAEEAAKQQMNQPPRG